MVAQWYGDFQIGFLKATYYLDLDYKIINTKY